jgi:hypothetical protein
VDEAVQMLMAPIICAKLEDFANDLRQIDKHTEEFDEMTFKRIHSCFWEKFGDYLE